MSQSGELSIHMSEKKCIVLGSTGSIGINTLDVIRRNSSRFSIAALSAHTDEKKLLSQAAEFNVTPLALTGAPPEKNTVTYIGDEGLRQMIQETPAHIVVNGIAGAAGCMPSRYALESGKDLALAN